LTAEPFSYEQFEETRERLVRDIHSLLQDSDRALLLSVKHGEPDWGLFPMPGLEDLPAVQWKLANIHTLKKNACRHAEQLEALVKALDG
jgi:hypothetical protein